MNYLNIAKLLADRHGYDATKLFLSDDNIHKLVYYVPDGRIIRFGRMGYGDYIHYKMQESQGLIPRGVAEEHRRKYLARSSRIKGDWKQDPYSKNNLAMRILWDA